MADLRASIEVALVDNASPNAKKIAAATEQLRAAQLRAAQAAGVVANAELQAASAALAEARGKAEAEGATDGLARAELRAANAARSVAQAELGAAKAASQHAQASTANASALSSRAAATEGASQASGGFLRNLFKVTDAQKAQGRSAAEGVNIVSEFALGFGALSPATRQASVEMAGAANSGFALGGVLGPMGVALALVIGAIPSAIKLYREFGEAAKDAAKASREATEAFNSAVQAELAQRRARDEEQAVVTGEADSETIDAAAEVSRRTIRDNEQRIQQRTSTDVGVMDVVTSGTFGQDLVAAFSDFAREGFDFDAINEGFARRTRQIGADTEAERARLGRITETGLPTARAREAQEALEGRAGESRQASSAAAAAVQRAVASAPGLSRAQRARLAEGAEQGRLPEDVFNRLPSTQQATIRTASDRAIQARQLAERDEVAAQRQVVTQVDERRFREDRAAPGELLFAGLVKAGGGANGGNGEALQRARADDPAAEASRESARRTEELTAAMRENTAARRAESSASRSGDAVLGGIE